MGMRRWGIFAAMLTITALFGVCADHAAAQTVPDRAHPRQVFIDHADDANGQDRVIFVDLLTGEERDTMISGDHYTMLQNTVLYHDRSTDRIMLLAPDLSTRPHPFIQKPSDGRRVDWLVSPDGQQIAWTITVGDSSALQTDTFVANLDGSNTREVLFDGPRDSIRAYPVAFDVNRAVLYMDYQPDAIGDFSPLRQYAGLFSVDLDTGDLQELPGEPGCFCGAGIGAGRFVRLLLADQFSGASGFNVVVRDLASGSLGSGAEQTIPTLNLSGYTQGGDVTIAPDGSQAIYALAQVRGFGTPQQTVQTVFVLVDLINDTQRQLTQPVNTWFHPVGWTEDSRALLLTSPTTDGTWKIDLADGTVRLIARSSYLGSLIPGAPSDN